MAVTSLIAYHGRLPKYVPCEAHNHRLSPSGQRRSSFGRHNGSRVSVRCVQAASYITSWSRPSIQLRFGFRGNTNGPLKRKHVKHALQVDHRLAMLATNMQLLQRIQRSSSRCNSYWGSPITVSNVHAKAALASFF